VKTGIVSTIGNTPLVELTRLAPEHDIRLFAKLEAFNPGGSIKDRAAFHILSSALHSGTIAPGSTIIESSSGNMGIGLAQICSYLNLNFICVVDPKTTQQNITILKAYGATIDLVADPDPITGEFLQARIDRVRQLRDSIPDSWWPDQYSNPLNAAAHHQTMAEIAQALENNIDYLYCSVSTCGTIRGCSEYIQQHGLSTRIMAVDAVGSVIFGQPSAKRLIPGHGASRRPELFQPDLSAECIHVDDLECVVGCHQLLQREAILAGGSSGAVTTAFLKTAGMLPPGSTCVLIFPDRGERYLDTLYCDVWIEQHFGAVAYLWTENKELFYDQSTANPQGQ